MSEKSKIKVIQNPQHELYDYKFFCFNGKCRCLKVDFGRFVDHHANYYKPNGESLPFGEKGLEPDFNYKITLPDNLNEMVAIAEKLAKGFLFLRVDLYNVNGRVYFGETTFYPASGLGRFTDDEWDKELGKWLHLSTDVINY